MDKDTSDCAANMPNLNATRPALRDAGLPFLYTTGRTALYSPDFNDIVVGIPATDRSRRPTCLIIVDGMTVARARQLIQPWLAAANAEPAPDLRAREAVETWRGEFRGGPVGLSIVDFRPSGVPPRGAGIAAASLL